MAGNMNCPCCGAEMNHHADKLLASGPDVNSEGAAGGAVIELHSCPACGSSASRFVSQ